MQEDIVISIEDVLQCLPSSIANKDIARMTMKSLPEFIEQMKNLLGFDGNELIHIPEYNDLILHTIILQAAHKALSLNPLYKKQSENLRQQKSIARDKLLNKLLFTDWHDSRARMQFVDKLMWNPTILRKYCSRYDKNIVLYDEEFKQDEPLLNKLQKEVERFVSPELMDALVHDVDREQPEIHTTLVQKLRELIAAMFLEQNNDIKKKKEEIMDYMMENINTPCLLYYKQSNTYRNLHSRHKSTL